MFDRIAQVRARCPDAKFDIEVSEEYKAVSVTVDTQRGRAHSVRETVGEAFDDVDQQIAALYP